MDDAALSVRSDRGVSRVRFFGYLRRLGIRLDRVFDDPDLLYAGGRDTEKKRFSLCLSGAGGDRLSDPRTVLRIMASRVGAVPNGTAVLHHYRSDPQKQEKEIEPSGGIAPAA